MRLAFIANLSISLSAVLLASCATNLEPVAAVRPEFTGAPLADSIPSDLPRNARPLHYAIEIEPDAEALTFTGQSSVTLELYQPADELVLHALELNIADAVLVAADGTRLPLTVSYRSDTQTAHFNAGRTLQPGIWRLETRYTGVINARAAGLFSLDYPDKRTGESVRGLFTQFEAPDARRFAPMFDEPSYKATFDLTAIVPSGQMAVGNMPVASETDLGDGRKRVSFATTPQMSSYLLFFANGDFERASARASDGTEIGVVSPVGSGDQARFALDSTLPLIPWLEDYFGTDYPLPKLDNIAAPGQSQFFGAMENWGAILTFESILLDDPAITSPGKRQQIYTTLAHEISHQWFGNIVTMQWWDDLWLNEGFASWLEAKMTHHFHPEWQQNLSRVDVRESAMGLDAFASTHPVVQEVRTVAELAQAFDSIAYSKGESVIGMLEAFAGPDVWQNGLRRYIARHAYANTTSADLWRAMEEAGASGLTGIAQDFTTQPGIPLVRVEGACVDGKTQLALTQSEFSIDRKAETAANPQAWRVPLWVASGTGAPQMQVLEGSGTAAVDGCSAPVIVNAGQLGYFRTLYSDELASRQLSGFSALPPIDQLGAMRDAFALARGDYQPLSRGLDLLAAVPGDANPVVAGFAANRWAEWYETLDDVDTEQRTKLAAIAQAKFGPRLAALGFDPGAGEPVVDANLRADLIATLGRMGDDRVGAEARRRFARLADNPRALDGPLKTTWLAAASAEAGEAEWDLLRQLAVGSTAQAERQSYFAALGDVEDDALAQRALEYALTGEAGTASAVIVQRVAERHPDLAFAFASDRAEEVRKLLDPSGWPDYLAGLAARSDDPAMIGRLEAMRATLPADEAQPFTLVIDAMRARLAEKPRQQQALRDWLNAHG